MIRAATLALLLCAPARATDVYIGVSGQAGAPQWTVGLAPFFAERGGADVQGLGVRLRGVVRDDLMSSRYFKTLDPTPGADPADLAAWKQAGAGFVLAGKVSVDAGLLSLTVQLKDAASGEAALARYYRLDARYWRSLAHRLADDVVKQLTGKPGIAHTQLAFVNDQSGNKEVYLVDYDGENLRRVTADKSIDLLPRWSPDGRRLVFTTYKKANPDLVELNLDKGSVRVLSARQGLNLPGGFSPDGKQLVATLSQGKNPNIYEMDMEDLSVRALTTHFGVDSSPTFSPDGNQVAFASDRSGNPQLHIMDLATGRVRKLTSLNWCDSPAWSPTGEWIVFAGRANNKDPMDLFIVDVTGSHVRQLTHGEGSNEDPGWSPDGRFIVFTSTRGGKRRRQLYEIDADGSAPRLVADIPGNSFTPNWSP